MAAPAIEMNVGTSGTGYQISASEFRAIRDHLYQTTGIDLAPEKKTMVASRLAKRLRHYNLGSYGDYFKLALSDQNPEEHQLLLDMLTTNETYFFREPGHFDFLRETVLPARNHGDKFRVWSAASSSGEEAYSIAMLLADKLGQHGEQWEIVGTDISSRVLEKAGRGIYPMQRIDGIPRAYLKKFCLRGTGPEEGNLLIDKKLRQRVRFLSANLNKTLPDLGLFDVIFLRNVLIYFDTRTKAEIVRKLLRFLRPDGYFFIGHSETLVGAEFGLRSVAHTTYQKIARTG